MSKQKLKNTHTHTHNKLLCSLLLLLLVIMGRKVFPDETSNGVDGDVSSVTDKGGHNICYSPSTPRFFHENSNISIAYSSSSESMEGAASHSSPSSSSSPARRGSSGPLYELSELMIQLPIKRGLSKYYQGKSQSFTSLSSVKSIEDLAKRENPCRKKMRTR